MCTVTIVPRPGGFRLLTNRDESRKRRDARPPAAHFVEPAHPRLRAIYPTDADAGGTWVAVTTAGFAATLLNANPPGVAPTDRRSGPRSRGELIGGILVGGTVDCVKQRLQGVSPHDYAPFRLVAVDGENIGVWRSDGSAIVFESSPLGGRPRLFTSSGLGDHVVEPPRRELFESRFGEDPSAWPAEQDAFHRHRWPDRPELSVCMSRADARSVSLTAVEVESAAVRMAYHAGPPCEAAEDSELELPR